MTNSRTSPSELSVMPCKKHSVSSCAPASQKGALHLHLPVVPRDNLALANLCLLDVTMQKDCLACILREGGDYQVALHQVWPATHHKIIRQIERWLRFEFWAYDDLSKGHRRRESRFGRAHGHMSDFARDHKPANQITASPTKSEDAAVCSFLRDDCPNAEIARVHLPREHMRTFA